MGFKTLWLYSLLILLVLGCDKIEAQIDEDAIEVPENWEEVEGYDIPENEGVRNVLLNADQITGCTYVTTNRLNALHAYEAGTTITGIVYSSSRFEDLMCPNNVSFWTYLTAMSDPASYQYTVDLSKPPYNLQGLAKTMYGQSCSSVVRYALGIQYSFQIHQMTVWDDFDQVMPNNVNSLKLGDMLTSEKAVHTRLVTGIKRIDNQVVSVIISEGQTPVAIKRGYSAASVQKMLDKDGYSIFRFRDISHVKHPPFLFDCIDTDVYPINNCIMPKRGDRANWRKDENVVIDVLDGNGYAYYRVYKDGDLYQEEPLIDNATEIALGILPAGDYKMFLVGKGIESDPVYWMVVDYHTEVKSIGGGRVRVSFSSCNAVPRWLTWRRPWSYNISNNDMPQWTTIISDDDLRKGSVETELDAFLIKRYGLGDWDFKVAFETKYGIISSDNIMLNVQK